MSNLFVIGNGFDLAHGLKTSYNNFKEYLEKEYQIEENYYCIPEYSMGNRGDLIYDENEVVSFIKMVLDEVEGDLWCDLEKSVGEIDFENYLDDYDDEDDYNPFRESYFNEGTAMSLVNPIVDIKKYFTEWIETIDFTKANAKNDFFELINKNEDFFLTFNYTKTLENIYDIDNICHIHGVQGGELLFGHGKDFNYFDDENYGLKPGTDNSFQKMHNELKKDTRYAINNNFKFFNSLKNEIDKIFFYGFSFSDVDQVYLMEICNKLDTSKIKCYLNVFHDQVTRNEYMCIFKKCGFLGEFDTFEISR